MSRLSDTGSISCDFYRSQQSRESDGYDSDSVEGHSIRSEVVRVVHGKSKVSKRQEEEGSESNLPLFPRILARIPFLSRKASSKRSSGGVDDNEVCM